jgi:hypothetical protein
MEKHTKAMKDLAVAINGVTKIFVAMNENLVQAGRIMKEAGIGYVDSVGSPVEGDGPHS